MKKVIGVLLEISSFLISWATLNLIVGSIANFLNIPPDYKLDECFILDNSDLALKCSQNADQRHFYGKVFVYSGMIIGTIVIIIINRIFFHKTPLNKKRLSLIYKECAILITVILLIVFITFSGFSINLFN